MTRSELNARMQPWDGAEIARFQRRIEIFTERGLTERAAESFADRLALRDQEQDDRRLCIECDSYVPAGRCRRRLPTTSDAVLLRCVGFRFQQ